VTAQSRDSNSVEILADLSDQPAREFNILSFMLVLIVNSVVIYVILSLVVGFASLHGNAAAGAYLTVLLKPPFLLPSAVVVFVGASYLTTRKFTREVALWQKKFKTANQDAEMYRKSLAERGKGFPTLMNAIDVLDSLKDELASRQLRNKYYPAPKAAEVVKSESKRRRTAELECRKTKAIIEYYEWIAPFLSELREEDGDVDENVLGDYDEEESSDPTTKYLTKEEYRMLSSVERNQLALDRFWTRPKSNQLLGRIYERYVGYLHETAGYKVDYVGIVRGYEDLGRDLICKKRKETVIIQCKNWSQFKKIYEKHIFQFFGTVFQYRYENPSASVRAIFWTTTQLSELSRIFAKELQIELRENAKFDKGYPCIKCNVSKRDGTKIYHLPFDQQYDKVLIESDRGEFYCSKVSEAENAGFRRAFRFHGIV